MARHAMPRSSTSRIAAASASGLPSSHRIAPSGDTTCGMSPWRVATAAVEQCHRARVPEITGVHPFSELADLLTGCPERWFLDRGGAAGMDAGAGPVGLLVGPEGGWTESEREFLLGLDCRPWGLGVRTLRVETAAVAGSSLLLLTDSAL